MSQVGIGVAGDSSEGVSCLIEDGNGTRDADERKGSSGSMEGVQFNLQIGSLEE